MKYLPILLLFCASVHGQSWSAILSSSRAIDWSHAGLPAAFPDGETTPNPWTPPGRNQCGPTLTPSGGDDVTQIINAFKGSGSFASCSPPYAVVLGSGTFHINSTLQLASGSTSQANRNNITLRGSGPMTTTVVMGSGGNFQIGACCVGGGSGALTSVGANYAAGQTALLMQNVGGGAPFVGAIAEVMQCDNGYTSSSAGTPLFDQVSGFGSATCNGSEVDTGQIYHCAAASCALNGAGSDTHHSEDRQIVRITSATNTGGSNWTVTISPGLYMHDWTFSQGSTLVWGNDSAWTSIGTGIEDMTIRPVDSGTAVSIGNGGYASWMKGIRIMAYNNIAIFYINGCSHCLVANNYFFINNPSNMQQGDISTVKQQDSGDSLWLNNISTQGSFMDDGPRHEGEVVAYNYSRDHCCNTDFYQATLFEHGPGSQILLRESNQWGRTNDDDTNSSHNLNTDFRNDVDCGDVPYIMPGARGGGLQYAGFARFENAIGNAIGLSNSAATSALCQAYQGTGTDSNIFNLNGGVADNSGLTVASLMRWGNVSYLTQASDTPPNSGIRFVSSEVPTNSQMPSSAYPNAAYLQNSVPANTNLPCTFFLQGFSSTTCSPLYHGGTQLSWWKVCTSWTTFPNNCAVSNVPPFPVNGPDVLAASGAPNNYANDIPAALAWKSLPIDATFQASYAVSGSSWAAGTETLAVVPMPLAFPIGGFQLTGAPAGCSPTSGVSYTGRSDGEILITGSSTTTISYALASNPGTQCIGTVKYPDVRQFDERVYMNDPSSTSLAPPTGLTVTVQ